MTKLPRDGRNRRLIGPPAIIDREHGGVQVQPAVALADARRDRVTISRVVVNVVDRPAIRPRQV